MTGEGGSSNLFLYFDLEIVKNWVLGYYCLSFDSFKIIFRKNKFFYFFACYTCMILSLCLKGKHLQLYEFSKLQSSGDFTKNFEIFILQADLSKQNKPELGFSL